MTKKEHKRWLGKETQILRLVEYEITWEPIPDARKEKLPKEVQEAIPRLHDEIKIHPRKVIPELLELIEKHPDYPTFYNFLSVAYENAGHYRKAKDTILENYRRNPDYLFARLNYAELCLAEGDIERIPAIFNHRFDLKLLYPQRKVFHITEVLNFMGIMGVYCAVAGKRDTAEQYYAILKQLDPDHYMTRRLGAYLHPGPKGR